VLESGVVAEAVLAEIKQENNEVIVVNRGAYLRVLVPRRCVVTRAAIEHHLGRTFRLPVDLERIMSAFKGRFTVSEEKAEWAFKKQK
jgi:hypothetical protein